MAAGYEKALDDRLPLYNTLVYQFSIKAVPEEEGAAVGLLAAGLVDGRRGLGVLGGVAVGLSLRRRSLTSLVLISTWRTAHLSTWPAWLIVLTAAHAGWPTRLIIHAVLPAADLHTDNETQRTGHHTADRYTSDCSGA